jgi:Flp pilus assembly protein TadD
MPGTVNGIGTMYYGRENASARHGTCSSCHKVTTLTSYDTREFFTILYVPIIPLTKYRILDQCASCRRHHRLTLKDFQDRLAAAVNPQREAVRRAPHDPDARQALIGALIDVGMTTEAEKEARAAAQAMPNSAALHRLAGQLLSMRGDLPGAAPYLERAVHLDPADGAARLSYGRVLYLQKSYGAAIPHLLEAKKIVSNDTTAPILLAECYEATERWSEAMAMWQQIGGAQPNKEILRRIAACKKKVGYPLSDAERRAARKWWPFGGSRRGRTITPVTPGGPNTMVRKPILIAGAVLAVFAVIALISLGVYNVTHVDVWLDSVYPRTTFVVDGKPIVADFVPMKLTLSPGAHRIVAKDRKGNVLEQQAIDIKGHGYLNAVLGEHAYVYNVRAARVYRRAEITYATYEGGQHYEQALYAGQTFFAIDDVDYMFVQAPKSIELSSSASTTTKVAFVIVPDATLVDVGLMQFNENKTKEAEESFRKAAAIEPCASRPREMLAYVQQRRGAEEEALKTAKSWMGDCPDTVEPHRLYQQIEQNRGHRDAVIAEYRALAESHPTSAPYRYLYGRLLGLAEGMAQQREAVKLDPKFPWAHLAIGYQDLSAGAFDEAMNEMQQAYTLGLDDQRSTSYLIYAAIGAHRADELGPLLPVWKEKNDTNAQWMMALAQKDWSSAEALCDAAAKGGADEASVWLMRAKLLELSGAKEELAQHIERGKANQETASIARIASIDRAFDDGDFADVIKQVDGARDAFADPLYPLYGAAAAMLQGDLAGGTKRAEDALKAMEGQELDRSTRQQMTAYANALLGRESEDALLADVRDVEPADIKHLYFFLGARAAAMKQQAHAKAMFRRSLQMSFDLGFPLRAAERLSV